MSEKAIGSKTSTNPKYQDFEFIGTTVGDMAGIIYNISKHFPKYVSSLEEIADFVFDLVTVDKFIVRRISIVTHGTTDGFVMGKDFITVATVGSHAKALKKLALVMFPSVASLELYSCLVGRNRALIWKLSTLLGDVPVIAYEQKQPSTGEGRGTAIRCKLQDCVRFDQNGSRRRIGERY